MVDPADEAAKLLKLLGDPTRVRIFRLLAAEGAMYAGAISERLMTIQPTVSHHLGLLKVAGVIDARREGNRMFYSLDPDARGRLAATLLYPLGLEGTKIPKAAR